MSYLDNNRAAIEQTWRNLGWSDNMIYGMLGRANRESSFNTGIVNPGDAGPGKDSVGLFQWNRERLAGLKSFAKRQGTKFTDPSTQAMYTHFEMTGKTTALSPTDKATGPEKATWRRLNEAGGLQDAVDAAMLYTRPDGTIVNGKLSARTGLHYKETLESASKFAGKPFTSAELASLASNVAQRPQTQTVWDADPKHNNAINVQKQAESASTDASLAAAQNAIQNSMEPGNSNVIGNLANAFMPNANTNQNPAPKPMSIEEMASLFRPRLTWAGL